MLNYRSRSFTAILLIVVLLAFSASPARAILGLFEKKSVNEQERVETMERIQDVQEKLKLLQDKLKALERRKAAQETTDAGVQPSALPGAATWQSLDETTVNPGEYGVYTYLLFSGDLDDTAGVGALEDLILTIETLPETGIPIRLGNRFLVPVEQPQSSIQLARQPYNFKLSHAYLQRLGLESQQAEGPILVSTATPVDPFAAEPSPEFLTVNLRHLDPEETRSLLMRWHQYEKSLVETGGHPLADLFLALLNGAGPTRVEHDNHRLLIDYSH